MFYDQVLRKKLSVSGSIRQVAARIPWAKPRPPRMKCRVQSVVSRFEGKKMPIVKRSSVQEYPDMATAIVNKPDQRAGKPRALMKAGTVYRRM